MLFKTSEKIKEKKPVKFRHGILAFGLLAVVMLVCVVGLGAEPRRGAPMGRPSIGDRSGVTGQRIYCRRVYLPIDGAYDKGGAYWGCGAPLYVEFTLDKSYVNFFRK